MNILPKSPSLHEVRNQVAALRRINLETVELPFLIERIKPLFHGFVVYTPILEVGQKVYRAVKWDKKYSTVARLSYPPPDKVKTFGRVNRPGQPVFYCSVAWNAPLFELRVEVGDHIALSRWGVTERLIVNNIGYTDAVFERLQSDRPSEPRWARRDGSTETPTSRLLQRFFSEEFAREISSSEEHLYKISNAVAHFLLHDIHEDVRIPGVKTNQMAGLVYPAIAMLGHSDNLAIKTDVVDNYLRLEQVEYLRVESKAVDGKFVTYNNTHLDFANTFAGDIVEWKERPAQWNIVIPPGGVVRGSTENGRQVFRDVDNNIIDPT
jgi:hypothetical protein